MPSATTTDTTWSEGFDTLRRERLFRHPPADHTAYPALFAAVRPHIESFDAAFERDGYLEQGLRDIGTKTFLDGNPNDRNLSNRNTFSVRIREFFLDKSVLPASNKFSTSNREIYPSECRERHTTYRGKFRTRLETKVGDGPWKDQVRDMGSLPILLRSSKCHLQNATPAEMVRRKEETEEFGGYFIVNGIEKLIRLLIVPKRNYPMAIIRPSYSNRGSAYTKYGIQIRSVRLDQSSQSNTLHYLDDGDVMFRFSWRKNEYLAPVMMLLKALVETNDREIFEGLVGSAGSKGIEEKQFVIDRAELLLRKYKKYNMHGKRKTRAYLGSKFRPVLGISAIVEDDEAGAELLRKIVLPHLGSDTGSEVQNADKFKMLLFMIRKLYSLVEGECSIDNPDAASNQEMLLPGQLYGMIIKERLEEWLSTNMRIQLNEWGRANNWKPFTDPGFEKEFNSRILKKTNEDIGRALEYFLSTGNLVSPTGLDLQQVSGYTVGAEKLNFYRFVSHFRSVHRGSFFAQLKTTTVRKLLPESWGFLCPVHTPDGGPCGLLNHLSHTCQIATKQVDVSAIPDLVAGLGVVDAALPLLKDSVVVQLDGRILGFCGPKQARLTHDTLRYWKVEGSHQVPPELEIGYIPASNGGQYPGIYMFSHPARMYRPVKYLPLDKVDYVGPFEQPFMSIACTEPEVLSGDSTHVEYTPTNILSIVANMTPFSEFNQSPRNMYQCQMGKQTMGTPGTAMAFRTDNKAYLLQTGQTPVVRSPLHNAYGLDNFPNGTNAVVAVISYTGYDMDDAMIINKSAHERGFGHGSIYKTKIVNLETDAETNAGRKARSVRTVTSLLGFAPGGTIAASWQQTLDEDGLPFVGAIMSEGSILCASHSVTYDPSTSTLTNHDGRTHLHRYKDVEVAHVESVRLLGSEDGSIPATAAAITLRIPRSPVIGDKFSSRHGQKGVCSQKWPVADMPFAESGIVPDVIINPHAFPSRMTIGMFIESLAGKSGALHGLAQDSTPFRFEDAKGRTAHEFFGEQLRAAGYNYHGNEPMYSGITGEELAADIYVGVVYYQRLRHMVNDKYQVRTTGPVNQLTGQPVKGRSKGGGIRIGEMERDALIAHGAAYLLQDRLMNCSDYARAWICRSCGKMLATAPSVNGYAGSRARAARLVASGGEAAENLGVRLVGGGGGGGPVRCRKCATRAEAWTPRADVWEDGDGVRYTGGEDTTVVAVPGVLRYLDAELASMGVGMKFKVKN